MKRLRPADSLNLKHLIEEMMPNTIATLIIEGKPWLVVAALSSYSPDIHVMIIEASVDRYLPGPEWIPDKVGNKLIYLWAEILDFIALREMNKSVYAGYNWSPRSWGEAEEATGFQSVPTKWHPMLWGWPPFPDNNQTTSFAKWVDPTSLAREEKRLLGDNNYAEPFGRLILSRLDRVFPQDTLFNKLFNRGSCRVDGRGIYIPFNISITDLLRTPNFFSQVLKPIARVIEQIARELTEAMTTFDCVAADKILLNTEKGALSDDEIIALRADPGLRSMNEIKKAFSEKQIPDDLLNAILEPVRNRCENKGEATERWRKGFGYSLVFGGKPADESGELRIMPGVFVGPGGVVEAQGVILRRPESKRLSDKKIKEKSDALWLLAEKIKPRHQKITDI